MLLRCCVVSMLVSMVLSSNAVKLFNYSCALEKPPIDSTFPTINLDLLELQVTRRVSHQLVTRIFAIFLNEILDFHKVSISNAIDEYPKTMSEEKLVEFAIIYELNKETAAINLETWVTADSHVIFPDSVSAGGSLHSDLVHYGLFISESQSTATLSYTDFISRSPSYTNIIKGFTLNREAEQLLENWAEKVHNPQQCNSSTEKCATVLTSFYDDMKFFSDHVDRLRLKLKIYYLGEKLPLAIKKLNSIISVLSRQKKDPMKYLVFHWTPSEIINGSKNSYRSLTMPSCELYKNETNNCRYDLIPVTIYFNEKVKETEDLMDIVRRFKFNSMKPIIDLYEAYTDKIENLNLSNFTQEKSTLEDYYNEIACTWLQENPKVYQIGPDAPDAWLQKTDGRREISIGGILPPDGTGREYDGILTAIEMAQNFTNNNPNILPDYKIEFKRAVCECKADVVLRHFINYYSHRKHLIGVLGPSCSEAVEPIAAISKHFKMSVITYSAEGISFDDRENFPYFFRTIGESKQYEDVYEKMLTELDWKRLAALTEDGLKYTAYLTAMESKLKGKNIELIVNKKFTREHNKEKQFESFKIYLEELRDNLRAKIIIVDVHDETLMKLIICAAHKLAMTSKNGYVFFLPVYVSMKMNDTGFGNEFCTVSEMESALDGHFALSHSSFGQDTDVIEGNQTVKEWKEQYLRHTGKSRIEFTDYATFSYDAFWVYVKALQQLIKEDTNPHWYLRNLYSDKTMEKVADLIHKMDFQGVSGRVRFSSGGSRFTNVNVLQWQGNDFVLVGMYTPSISNRTLVGSEFSLNNKLKWLSGERPTDGRHSCSLQAVSDLFGTSCQTIYTILTIIGCIVIVFSFSSFSFLFWKRKYDAKVVESEKFLGNFKNIMHGTELIKWEIPRENCVINRRLGEGAFGTVYGGEASIKEGDGWTAVAIKTLKPGSTAENRLDFLAELDTMKRFEHKNIVKLLAVCLQSEPLYAVMELMLYGDLKTYLLGRRHLVSEKVTEDSDVNPKRLTLAALDVARGLSYLASVNFVHRDIACRNCMINAQRVVKIGDFGMARQTFESEYYRFQRKAMLPVRWMSPESLNDGIFSHSTDIWSFGVLLFEIVTMGAFPFQGLTNNQVFEHVKLGNSLKIPATCKPHLKALLSSCFSLDPTKRPGASTIVEFLSSNPRMLTPSLDVQPILEDQINLINGDDDDNAMLDQLIIASDNRDRSHTPFVDVLRTSVSASALQNNHQNNQDPSTFEYLDMQRPTGFCMNDFNPDLTATLPNGNYNPVEPLLQTRPEISKSNLSLMKYMPMCISKKNYRSSPDECTSAL